MTAPMQHSARSPTYYSGYIFDLDDTLYDELTYLKAGYNKIGLFVQAAFGVDAEQSRLWLLIEFQTRGRHRLFDRFCATFRIPATALPEMVRILRSTSVEGGLNLYPWADAWLSWIVRTGRKFAIVTNGDPGQQRNKQAQIKSATLRSCATFICAREIRSKPSGLALIEAIGSMQTSRGETLMIGDHCVDKLAAENAGIDFLHASELERFSTPGPCIQTADTT
jgi:putative hydrolase of the HAD superfamily